MNHIYLYFSFLAYNYICPSAIWYKSRLPSNHIKSSLRQGAFFPPLVLKNSIENLNIKMYVPYLKT